MIDSFAMTYYNVWYFSFLYGWKNYKYLINDRYTRDLSRLKTRVFSER